MRKSDLEQGIVNIFLNIIFVITTGIYLFSVETESTCTVGEKDVAGSFNITLWIILISHIMGMVSGILQILDFSQIKSLLCCAGGFLGLAGWIMMHFVRFSYSGQVCSGTADNINLEDQI